jgi:WD40 repeat protein
MSIRFNTNSDLLACGTIDSSINVFSMKDECLFKEIQKVPQTESMYISVMEDVRYPVTSIRWIPAMITEATSDTMIASYGNGIIKFWDVEEQSKLWEIDEPNPGIFCLDYTKLGDKFATGGIDRAIRVYSAKSKKLISEMKTPLDNSVIHHSNRIHCVKFDKDEHVLYSGGIDKVVTVHDTRWKEPLYSIIGPYVIGETIDVNENYLLVGSYRSEDCVQVWDVRTRNIIISYDWNDQVPKAGGQVVSAMFSKHSLNAIIAACAETNEIKVFNQDSKDSIATIKGFESMIYCMDQSHDGSDIAVGTKDGNATVLEYN